MLYCYEAKNPEACKVIAEHDYPINTCCNEYVSAIPSGIELLCKYINNWIMMTLQLVVCLCGV